MQIGNVKMNIPLLKQLVLVNNKYIISGAYGDVVEAICKKTNKKVAIKR